MPLKIAVTDTDHVQGDRGAQITLIEYGDFECFFSGAAYDAIQETRTRLGDSLCFVFRAFPLDDIHPHAMRAAEAGEAATAQGKFWPMYDRLFENQNRLEDEDLLRYAVSLNLDMDQFSSELRNHTHRDRLLKIAAEGRELGVHGTPSFFINGEFYDSDTRLWVAEALLAAMENAGLKGIPMADREPES